MTDWWGKAKWNVGSWNRKKNSSGKSGEIQINSVNLIYCTKVDFLAYINIQCLLDINMGGVGKAYTATLCIFATLLSLKVPKNKNVTPKP